MTASVGLTACNDDNNATPAPATGGGGGSSNPITVPNAYQLVGQALSMASVGFAQAQALLELEPALIRVAQVELARL